MTKANDTKPDDLEAVRSVAAALEKFPRDDQIRILRWAQEKLGISTQAPAAPAAPAATPATRTAPGTPPATPATPAPGGAADIRSFITRKNPASDVQLAAAIAYYYQFEAPQETRKSVIKSGDLKEAARAIGQGGRFKRPAQTLVNAHQQGLLDRPAAGEYAISNVGENLVAVTLGAEGGDGTTAAPTRRRVRAKRKAAKKKAKKTSRR
jgi:hypothetical protein